MKKRSWEINKNEPRFCGWSRGRVAAMLGARGRAKAPLPECEWQNLKSFQHIGIDRKHQRRVSSEQSPPAESEGACRVMRLMKARRWMLMEMPQMYLICWMRLHIAISKCCKYVCRNIRPSWPAGLQQVFGIDVHSPTCPQISAETLERPVAHVITGCIWPARSDINIRFCLY